MSSNTVSWIISLLTVYQSSFYRNSSLVHPWSHRQCNRIIEGIMSRHDTRPLCCFWHHWPWYLDHPSLILAHGSVLSWFKSYLSSRCFPVECETDLSSLGDTAGGCPHGVPTALFLVLYSSSCTSCAMQKTSYFLLFPKHLPLRRWLLCSFVLTHFDSTIGPSKFCSWNYILSHQQVF